MDEVIVEGFDYEDFVTLKRVLENNAVFTTSDEKEYINALTLIKKADKIIEVFEE